MWQAVHALSGFHPLNVAPEGNNALFDQDLRNVGSSTRMIFGNLPFYVFFRLYQKLYQRLADARSLAATMDERLASDKAHSSKVEVAAKADAQDSEGDRAADDKAKSEDAAKQTTYSKFMDMLISLVEGNLDNGTCRF